jgi:hypothetical protein
MIHERGKLNDGHRGRLFTSLIQLEETHRQILMAIRDGISPNSGQRLTPLNEEEWKSIDDALRGMKNAMSETVNRYAHEWMEERAKAEDRKSTLFYLSVLMNELEDQLLLDLSPSEIQANYGRLEEEDVAVLQNLHETLAYHIMRVKEEMRRMREAQEGQR